MRGGKTVLVVLVAILILCSAEVVTDSSNDRITTQEEQRLRGQKYDLPIAVNGVKKAEDAPPVMSRGVVMVDDEDLESEVPDIPVGKIRRLFGFSKSLASRVVEMAKRHKVATAMGIAAIVSAAVLSALLVPLNPNVIMRDAFLAMYTARGQEVAARAATCEWLKTTHTECAAAAAAYAAASEAFEAARATFKSTLPAAMSAGFNFDGYFAPTAREGL